jgi:hypothetical protein
MSASSDRHVEPKIDVAWGTAQNLKEFGFLHIKSNVKSTKKVKKSEARMLITIACWIIMITFDN